MAKHIKMVEVPFWWGPWARPLGLPLNPALGTLFSCSFQSQQKFLKKHCKVKM